ncbi:MAG TPA: serine hydrolase domain-containing protein [Thermoanaerobaculia bacterium]|nr:serine hydrolase domain-containing protein [Thermoanaerobaculia bacterium]
MLRPHARRFLAVFVAALAAAAAPAVSKSEPVSSLSPSSLEEIDRAAREILFETGAPSASVAVVAGGEIACVRAYGRARLDPPTPARTDMRYAIGSISKQFTVAAILMLAQEGKLSLDDPVARFLPDLTRARQVTIRQLLSHTSGYQDYWPQDYVPPFMLGAITREEILDRWAKKPLDFEPGTDWQYSNTGFVAAGAIVEKASGQELFEFLVKRVFKPLGMGSVADVDRARLGDTDALGYLRYGVGPPRRAPKEGRGWLFAAGELAMTAEDLARWNLALLRRRLLSEASLAEMETETRLKNGLGTRYGLGIGVTTENGRRALEHGGEVSGFTATNIVLPDDAATVTVLTNQDSNQAAPALARRIVALLLEGPDVAAHQARARHVFEDLQRGRVDRSLLTENASSYFTSQALQDFAGSLGPLGKPTEVKQTACQTRGGMTFRLFHVKLAGRSLEVWERDMPDGKIEQYQVMALPPAP